MKNVLFKEQIIDKEVPGPGTYTYYNFSTGKNGKKISFGIKNYNLNDKSKLDIPSPDKYNL